jgi:hypothetical protein
MRQKSLFQIANVVIVDRPRKQVIQFAFELKHTALIPCERHRLFPLNSVAQMDRSHEKAFQRSGPELARKHFDHALEVSELMRQEQLELFGQGFQLRLGAVADPFLDCPIAKHGSDLGGAESRPDVMIDPGQADEDPLPPVTPLDAGAGLIAIDHPVGDDLLIVLFGGGPGALACAAENGGNPSFAQLDPIQIAQRGDNPHIAQMLGLLVIDHTHREVWSEETIRFKSLREQAAIERLAMRTENFVLLRLDNERVDRRDFGGLPPDDSLRLDLRQVGLAGPTLGHGSRDNLIGLLHQWSNSVYRGARPRLQTALQGLAFPAPVPIFATWHPNHENETNIAIEALVADKPKVTDALLGEESFGGGLFPYPYEGAGGWALSPKQLPQERRSWKDDLYDYRK